MFARARTRGGTLLSWLLLATTGACTMPNPDFQLFTANDTDGSTDLDAGDTLAADSFADSGSTELDAGDSGATADSSDSGSTSDSADTSDTDACPPGTVDCDGLCSTLKDDPLNCGGCGMPCADDSLCEGGDCVPIADNKRLVFVSSVAFVGGALGPLADAHTACTELAKLAGHDGEFRAWLGVGQISPSTTFVPGGPFVLADGNIVAESTEALLAGELLHPIDRTEWGQPPSANAICDGAAVWTGLNTAGQTLALNCSGWSSVLGLGTTGFWDQAGASWTESLQCVATCNAALPIYCFQK